jgi:carboxymethylenebutenolidase
MSRSRFWTVLLIVFALLLVSCRAPAQPSAAPPSLAPSVTAAAVPATVAPPSATAPISKQRVTFQSDGLTLVGFLFKPAGPGPFPGLIWNHGSEQNPGAGPEFDAVASIFVPAGYVVFAPMRRGHGESQGPYISDQVAQVKQAQGIEAARNFFVQQMSGPQLDDQLAGLAYLKSQPYVDANRLAVVGCSYGGIETLFAAERGAGFKAAVAESPGAESWEGNPALQARLL